MLPVSRVSRSGIMMVEADTESIHRKHFDNLWLLILMKRKSSEPPTEQRKFGVEDYHISDILNKFPKIYFLAAQRKVETQSKVGGMEVKRSSNQAKRALWQLARQERMRLCQFQHPLASGKAREKAFFGAEREG
ncbi:hypothetical protein Tco_0732407 [Tanacetum coccineum]